MAKVHDDTNAKATFAWMFTSVSDWSRLLMAAQEVRHADEECLDALIEGQIEGGNPLSPADATKVRSLVQMLRSLDLDPDAISRLQPETMRVLETTCVGCTEPGRCDRELALGTAAENRAEFCPNTPRLNAMLGIMAASG